MEGIHMAVDRLQDKIRKLKNPSVVELCLSPADLPPYLLEEEGNAASAYLRFSKELLTGLKGIVPAVRVNFASFALLGGDGFDALAAVLKFAKDQGFYVALDAPEILSPKAAVMVADSIFGTDSKLFCDGLIIGGYPGSDIIKPFLGYCKTEKKDLFVVTRTANKSAPELQDLLAGTRLVHVAAADHVNRYGSDTVGKSGYSGVGILAAASAAESLRNLRGKYPKLFLLLDGYDYPNANAKNCSYAFDKFGHGAAAVAGTSITCAWKQTESDGHDFVQLAVSAAERMKKNLTRYTTVL